MLFAPLRLRCVLHGMSTPPKPLDGGQGVAFVGGGVVRTSYTNGCSLSGAPTGAVGQLAIRAS